MLLLVLLVQLLVPHYVLLVPWLWVLVQALPPMRLPPCCLPQQAAGVEVPLLPLQGSPWVLHPPGHCCRLWGPGGRLQEAGRFACSQPLQLLPPDLVTAPECHQPPAEPAQGLLRRWDCCWPGCC